MYAVYVYLYKCPLFTLSPFTCTYFKLLMFAYLCSYFLFLSLASCKQIKSNFKLRFLVFAYLTNEANSDSFLDIEKLLKRKKDEEEESIGNMNGVQSPTLR